MGNTENPDAIHEFTRHDSPSKDNVEKLTVSSEQSKPDIITSLLAGAAAGVTVDALLYPLDTLKTRLQSSVGFLASGGFNNIYKGIGPVLLGSAPISALFFASYNGLINYMKGFDTQNNDGNDLVAKVKNTVTNSNFTMNFTSAIISEFIGATLRVPLEVVKQRKQVSDCVTTSMDIVRKTLNQEGIVGLYRGFLSTISREIPFVAIQFPLWEYMKEKAANIQGRELTPLEVACCGAVAGAVSAAITTPLDVIKTRIMLADKKTLNSYHGWTAYYIAKEIVLDRGLDGLFAGLVPRVMWISLGGFIYFGMYEFTKAQLQHYGYTYDSVMGRFFIDSGSGTNKSTAFEKGLSAASYDNEIEFDDAPYKSRNSRSK